MLLVEYAEDSIEAALSFAESADVFDSIEIFTDRPVARDNGNIGVSLHSVKSSDNNSNFSIQNVSRTEKICKSNNCIVF